ncbi:oxidase ustYa family protein [Aspergillus clavatus NRRL 1]|uniref:Tat pathway signal sequence n=1 Tax=Aspergillus clavatus (strain ATCC 1007 / CBS 513.65 / DSM 816 / NCTC 3887 / NRRL 1 / QM 1276 / 107) TaxID=344612 RepID=A1CCV6_ASPCL|nr:uncharacterized protein ACLA_063300 [Aspergillus clavatus NRRL 1]EAW12363.1 conserved hypothetical protein [Aspergillus clavatus NRRL 1]
MVLQHSDRDYDKNSRESSSTLLQHHEDGFSGQYAPSGRLREYAGPSRRWQDWIKWSVIFANTALFIASITLFVKSVSVKQDCPSVHKPSWAEQFEPDLRYDSRVTFQPHSYFGGPPSNETNEMWQRLSPPGDGIVEVPIELAKNLPASLPAPNNPDTMLVYGVSVFHQLHCLNFLRFAYYPESVVDYPPNEIAFHRDHCLDYIRQALICHADATFEPLTQVGINGMGAIHQCRDFEKVFSWAYEHRSDKVHSGYTGGKVTHTPGHRNDFDEEQGTGHHH